MRAPAPSCSRGSSSTSIPTKSVRVYDIHSPRVPATTEITGALKNMARVLDDTQIWVNPDCGLKTRGWDETLAALRNMVQAAKQMRDGRDTGNEQRET